MGLVLTCALRAVTGLLWGFAIDVADPHTTFGWPRGLLQDGTVWYTR